MISTGEASGDLHGAGLISAIKRLAADVDVCGIGGKALQGQGVELLHDVSGLAVTGFIEVFSHLSDIRAAKNAMEQRLKEWHPHLLILIDYPDFNFMLAKKANRLGIPILYYISPQVWAWRSGRAKKISRLVDRMAVILPFEQEFYRQRQIEVDFVGHPLLDSVKPTCSGKEFLKRNGLSLDSPYFSPGWASCREAGKKKFHLYCRFFWTLQKGCMTGEKTLFFCCPLRRH